MRKLRHILDIVHAFLLSSLVPTPFWGEATLMAVYNINRLLTPVLANCIPHEWLFGTSLTYHRLRVFGSAYFVLLQPHERTKLEPHSRLCCFLGYRMEQKGYRCYDPVSHHLRISHHVVFSEHKLFHKVGKFCISSFPLFPTLLETPLSPPPTSDIFPESSSLELHSSDAYKITPLKSPDFVQSEAPVHTSPLELHRSTWVKSLQSHL